MKRRVRSVIEWRKFPDEKPTAQMVLVFADGAINTIFGNGLASFIRAGAEFVYWANLPDLRLGDKLSPDSHDYGRAYPAQQTITLTDVQIDTLRGLIEEYCLALYEALGVNLFNGTYQQEMMNFLILDGIK